MKQLCLVNGLKMWWGYQILYKPNEEKSYSIITNNNKLNTVFHYSKIFGRNNKWN